MDSLAVYRLETEAEYGTCTGGVQKHCSHV